MIKHNGGGHHEWPSLRALDRLLEGLARITEWACHALLLVIVGVTVMQVALRFLLNRPTSWSEEVALLCLVWFGMLAVALGVREHGHIAITALRDALPRVPALALDILAELLVLAFALFLMIKGGDLVSLAGAQILPASQLPKLWLYLPASVGGALMALNALGNLLLGRWSPPVPEASPPEALT
ncbi:TRAP transporter small permease [Marinimicrococcus flavescens]|uniref:TRAP transporter small permease protein n=1 Tax=Marinimicrococcus flavescens TaxID=3031815 RepID=A0AAP3XSQ2_9PROT|nr:TRAP transporter small permease [Marinimicrococcus flavescens]